MIDPAHRAKVLMYLGTSSMKRIEVKTGTVVAPYTTSVGRNTVTIPHGMGTSDLLWMCLGEIPDYAPEFSNVSTPLTVGVSGRTRFWVEVDATNLYVIGESSTAGSPQEAVTFNFKLYIVLP